MEKDLRAARLAQSSDKTAADERNELDRQLKHARLEVEELQTEVVKMRSKIDSTKSREREQRDLVKRLQAERTAAIERCENIQNDLLLLQERHEQKREKIAKQKQIIDDQHSQLARPNPLERQLVHNDRRHQQELSGLAKQIQWLRAKGKREEAFRAGLAFEKRFLIMNIELYESFNQIDLGLLEKMGITPDTRAPKKRPTLRAVISMVQATVRMKKGMKSWRETRKLKESLLLKAQSQMKALGKRKTAA